LRPPHPDMGFSLVLDIVIALYPKKLTSGVFLANRFTFVACSEDRYRAALMFKFKRIESRNI
jgi:hypothetical protein